MKQYKLEKFHDDVITMYAQKDIYLKDQATKLADELSIFQNTSANFEQEIVSTSFLKILNKFITVFSPYSQVYLEEHKRRELPALKHQPIIENNITHELVKLKEELESCAFRHDDIKLAISMSTLNKRIDTMLTVISNNPISTEQEMDR